MTSVDLASQRVRRHRGPERTADERELALAYQQDPSCREQVVRALAPIARSIAARYHYAKEPREDLEQVALMGLVKALRGFDPVRSRSFAAYAYPTITGELRRHFRDTGWAAHVPRGTKELALQVRAADRDTDGVADDDALAARLGVPVARVREGRHAGEAMLADSLTAPAGDEGRPNGLADGPGQVDGGFGLAEDRATVDALLDTLPEDKQLILQLRFRAGLSQRQIGERIGVSQMQVCRLLRRTLGELADRAAEVPA
jgi:RNA polymerase sigma-B factor